MKALFRSGADAWYRQGGEECEVIATDQRAQGTLYRVRFADETETWAERDEVVLDGEDEVSSIDPAQGALPGIGSDDVG